MKNLVVLAFLGMIALSGCQNKPERTIANLQASVEDEVTASVRYAGFAAKARDEGYENIAKLFDAAARAERVHAERYKEFLDQLDATLQNFQPQCNFKSTAENLQTAIDLETKEVNTIYPKYMTDAKAEGKDEMAETMGWALSTEKKHLIYLSHALDVLKNKPDSISYLPGDFKVCPLCGNTYDSTTMEKNCVNCQTPSDMFIDM
jgi:rubrerythrin